VGDSLDDRAKPRHGLMVPEFGAMGRRRRLARDLFVERSRDVTPQNVLTSQQGEVKLADSAFGDDVVFLNFDGAGYVSQPDPQSGVVTRWPSPYVPTYPLPSRFVRLTAPSSRSTRSRTGLLGSPSGSPPPGTGRVPPARSPPTGRPSPSTR
jgi:hypothetical protein